MSKTKFKFLVTTLLLVLFTSTMCFATSEMPIESGVTNTVDNTNSEVAPIAEDSSEPIATTDESATTSTEESSWVNNDLYVTGENITVNQIVDGNAFIIGTDVKISGEIGGDLFVIADKLTISSENQGGYVYSNIFAMANEITIDGIVYDVYAMCNTFNLNSNGYIYRDIKLIAKDINLSGFIRRDAYITASNLNFNYKPDSPVIINGNVTANVEKVNFTPISEITTDDDIKVVGGNFKYSSNSEITDLNKYVAGEANYSKSVISTESNTSKTIYSYLYAIIGIMILTIIVINILGKVAPNFVQNSGNLLTKKIGSVIGYGILGLIVFPILIFLLLISGVGTYLAIALACLYALLIAISTSILAISISQIIFNKKNITKKLDTVVIAALISVVILVIGELLSKLGIFGFIFSLIVNILSFGIILSSIFSKKKNTEKVEVSSNNQEDKADTKEDKSDDSEIKKEEDLDNDNEENKEEDKSSDSEDNNEETK